jgi:hypothetical protein
VKYTDPDGKIAFPFVVMGIIVATTLVSSSQPRFTYTDLSDSAWGNYDDGHKVDTGVYIGKTPISGSVQIKSNLIERMGDSLSTPNDSASFGEMDLPKISDNSMQKIANIGGFANDTTNKFRQTGSDGSHVGDIKISYESLGGKVTSWTMHKTIRDQSTGNVRNSQLSREEARSFLKALGGSNDLEHQKIYKEIQNLFN